MGGTEIKLLSPVGAEAGDFVAQFVEAWETRYKR